MLLPQSSIREILVAQGQQSLLFRAAQFQDHRCFPHVGKGAVPTPAIDEPLRRPDFEKLAADRNAIAAARSSHGDPPTATHPQIDFDLFGRSEERRVGKEGRSRWSPYH